MKANRLKKNSKGMNVFSMVRNITVLVIIFAFAIVIFMYIQAYPVKSVFPVEHIAFAGNKHLTDDELRILAQVHLNESLVMISNKKVSQQLLKSPWIKSVNIRKDFPDTLLLTIQETEPFALLDMHEHLFLIDENGKLLEELKGDAIPFLPVIKGDPLKDKDGFSDALNLVKLMNAKGFSSERDHIQIIARKAHDISLEIDGTLVKIGTGGYEEKLERLIRLEEDIKNMSLHVEYIDLRFSNKAIVKPVNEKIIK